MKPTSTWPWSIWVPLLAGIVLLAVPLVAGESPQSDAVRLFEGLRDQLRDPAALRPATHTERWILDHGSMAGRLGSAPCDACHTESQCADCHSGRQLPTQVHPPGYLVLHGHEALVNTADCTSCHTPDRFCASCHTQAELTRTATLPLGGGVQVHPPHWLNPAAPGNHGDEARRNVLACASCHSGEDCASCHAWINPHGRDFSQRCRQMLDANAATCARCHTPGSLTPLPALRNHPTCQR